MITTKGYIEFYLIHLCGIVCIIFFIYGIFYRRTGVLIFGGMMYMIFAYSLKEYRMKGYKVRIGGYQF